MSKSEFSRPAGTDGKGILGSDGLNPKQFRESSFG